MRPGHQCVDFAWKPLGCLMVGLVLVAGCSRREPERNGGGRSSSTPLPHPASAPSAAPSAAASLSPAAGTSARADAPGSSLQSAQEFRRYAWLQAPNAADFQVTGTLESRFRPPPGYTRVALAPASFAAWLRGLPLSPEGTPVVRYDGSMVHAAEDPYVAAVVAIDIGSVDLQQSADVLIRLHAEWLWSEGKREAIDYPGSTKLAMPLSRWEKGQRLISQGPNVFWAVQTKPQPVDYREFRRYLDAVFAWANSSSLARRTKRIEKSEDVTPGDFFLHTKPPGHVAILLDVAEKASGERVALLGQALSPTESVHVIRPGRATAWFSLRPNQPLVTAHSAEFNWDELRRLETGGGEADATKRADDEKATDPHGGSPSLQNRP